MSEFAWFASLVSACYAMFMCNLLIKLNILLLLLVLPLQGFAAASLLHCQRFNPANASIAKTAGAHEQPPDSNQMAQSDSKSENCHGAAPKATKSAGEAPSKSICPHCDSCGIYSPALMTGHEPVAPRFTPTVLFSDVDANYTSFFPQGPLHPPSLV
ncbi:MAG: hypothetical protein WCB36_12840 [Burkholderiales bacterium]